MTYQRRRSGGGRAGAARAEGVAPRPARVGRQAGAMSAQDLLLQALPALYRLERPAFLEARRLLQASLRADPNSSVVHGWLAQWNLLYVGQGWAENPEKCAAEAAELSERA